MPVVWGDDGNGIDLFVVQDWTKVPVRHRLNPGLILYDLQRRREELFIRVANRPDLHVVTVLQSAPAVEVDRTLVSDTDDRDIDPFVGPTDGGIGFGAEAHSADGDSGRSNHAVLDEVSSVGRIHDDSRVLDVAD